MVLKKRFGDVLKKEILYTASFSIQRNQQQSRLPHILTVPVNQGEREWFEGELSY